MEEMYQEYKGIAEFYMVYISEAHAMDDRHPVPYAKDLGIKEHTTFGERCSVAKKLLDDKSLSIPCLTDKMDNAVQDAYHALPDRIFLVRKDGALAVAGKRGPWGFAPALRKVDTWLASYEETGKEPAITEADTEPDFREMSMELMQAFEKKDYTAALDIAKTMHEVDPKAVDVPYNIACIHSLLGHQDEAYAWLNKAIEIGYDDADHLVADDDFKTMRHQDRFKQLVKRLRDGKSSSKTTEAGGEIHLEKKQFRGLIGPDSSKIKVENGKTYVWAGGNPRGSDAIWYDFTGAPFPAAELQFGIGKDRIRAIDDPLFVDPDDPRLLSQLRPSPYRPKERPKINDDIMVIGYADGDDARAYPAALLDGHELVNDRLNGKPITVGW